MSLYKINKTITSRGLKEYKNFIVSNLIKYLKEDEIYSLDVILLCGWNPLSEIQAEKELFSEWASPERKDEWITINKLDYLIVEVSNNVTSKKSKQKKVKQEHNNKNNTRSKDTDYPVTINTSKIVTPEFIAEQIYKEGKCAFLKYNLLEKCIEEVEFINYKDILYLPIGGEEVETQAVILPDGVEDYDSIEKLDDEIKQFINRWLDINELEVVRAIWNIRFSWVYERFETLNYTRGLGDQGTGKSRLLNIIGRLHYKPMIVAGALTPAVIFRVINKWKGTLLIDEGDQQKGSDETNAFIKILNCGYERGTPVSRCDKNDPNKIQFFDIFCPKVITTRNRFEDQATEARCMTITMVQTNRKDIPDILTSEYYTDVQRLRRKLLMYRFKNYHIIDPEIGLKIDLNKYEPRLRQVNRSYISLFAHDPNKVDEFKSYLDKYQDELISERSLSFTGIIVNGLATLISRGETFISANDLIRYFDEIGEKFHYNLTSRSVSNVLKGLGIKTRLKKIKSETKRSYILEESVLISIFSRYIPDTERKNQLINLCYYMLENNNNYSKKSNVVTQVTQIHDRTVLEKEEISKKVYTFAENEKSAGCMRYCVTSVTALPSRHDQNVSLVPEKEAIMTENYDQNVSLPNSENEMKVLDLKKDLLSILSKNETIPYDVIRNKLTNGTYNYQYDNEFQTKLDNLLFTLKTIGTIFEPRKDTYMLC